MTSDPAGGDATGDADGRGRTFVWTSGAGSRHRSHMVIIIRPYDLGRYLFEGL